MKKNHQDDKRGSSRTKPTKAVRPQQPNHPLLPPKYISSIERSGQAAQNLNIPKFRNPAENATLLHSSPFFIFNTENYSSPVIPSPPPTSPEISSLPTPERSKWPVDSVSVTPDQQQVVWSPTPAVSDSSKLRSPNVSSPHQLTQGCPPELSPFPGTSFRKISLCKLDEHSTLYSLIEPSKIHAGTEDLTDRPSTGTRQCRQPSTAYRSCCAGASRFGLSEVLKPARQPTKVNVSEMFQKSVAGKPVKSGMRGNFRTGVSVAVQRAESLRKGTRNQTANKQKPCRNFCTETSQEPTYERTRISRAESEIRKLVSTKRVVLFSSNNRKECAKLAEIFESIYVDIAIFELNELGERGRAIESVVRKDMNRRDFPAVFLNGTYFGDLEDVTQAEADGRLEAMVGTAPRTYDFDLFVIGGGSGGLAAAKEASNLEKRVGIADFVDPTPLGNSWGLGGTCINVGCIPKKLMHQAALYGDCLKIMAPYGWDVSVGKHKWSTLIENVQNYIKSLNWVTKKELKKKSVQFFKSHASILDPHTIELDTPNEPSRTVTARNILIAIGTRPRYPDIPNARELCITSDDIFSQKYPPGTTLVVGASYVGLECAGFLQSLGFNTTVLVRSRVLNGFDEQMANLVRHQMEDHGTKFLDGYVFAEIRRIADGKPPTLQVKMKREETGEEVIANYNTVLLAIGRLPQLKNLGTENLGIAVDTQSGRIIGDELERTSCRNVFVVGDALHGRPQLTPVAIHAGVLLARRLFAKSRETMNYDLVPTTVFTPLEYGSVGFSEEVAVRRFAPAVRVYHSTFTPYEHKLDTGDTNRSYAKIVCVQCPKGWRLGDPLEDFAGNDSSLERVVGFHLLSPSAGEITQGFGVAMRMGLTLQDLANSIGIHPTMAAIFLKLKVKREGDFGEEALCCN